MFGQLDEALSRAELTHSKYDSSLSIYANKQCDDEMNKTAPLSPYPFYLATKAG